MTKPSAVIKPLRYLNLYRSEIDRKLLLFACFFNPTTDLTRLLHPSVTSRSSITSFISRKATNPRSEATGGFSQHRCIRNSGPSTLSSSLEC